MVLKGLFFIANHVLRKEPAVRIVLQIQADKGREIAFADHPCSWRARFFADMGRLPIPRDIRLREKRETETIYSRVAKPRFCQSAPLFADTSAYGRGECARLKFCKPFYRVSRKRFAQQRFFGKRSNKRIRAGGDSRARNLPCCDERAEGKTVRVSPPISAFRSAFARETREPISSVSYAPP